MHRNTAVGILSSDPFDKLRDLRVCQQRLARVVIRFKLLFGQYRMHHVVTCPAEADRG